MQFFRLVINITAFLGAAVFWEFVAWFMHKYIMHGFGWYLHQDHHLTHGRRFQKNDFYALFFAAISFCCIFFGLLNAREPLAAAGFGIALYGVCYVVFHDIMFHHRIKRIKYKPKNPYMQRIILAHRNHHRTTTKEGAINFGFLWARKA